MISDDSIRAITSAIQLRDRSHLSVEQNKLLEFFSFADDTIRNYGTGGAVKIIQDKFDCSRSTAYEYIKGAQWVFGSTYVFEKNYHKGILLEQIDTMILLGMKSCISEVETEDDEGNKTIQTLVTNPKIYAAVDKYIQSKKELLQLDKEDPPFLPEDLHKLPMLTARPEDVGITPTELSIEVQEIIKKHGGRVFTK